jgi:hypothetical protein
MDDFFRLAKMPFATASAASCAVKEDLNLSGQIKIFTRQI